MKKILRWKDISSIKLVVQSVKNNNLILGTTDTILGLFAPVTLQGKEFLDCVKKREKKPYIILLSEKIIESKILKSIPEQNILYSIIKNFWPGPLTIVFNTDDLFDTEIIDQETIAVRVPAHEGIKILLEEIHMVFSTSANLAGQQVPANIEEVDPTILKSVEYCIVDESHEQLPSTIIRYDKNNIEKPITLIREGLISKEALKKISEKLSYL